MLKVRKRCVPVLLLLAAAACSRNSERIEGPVPVLSDLQPRVMCVSQGDRELTLTGQGLAPLVVDAASGNARVLLPQLFLLRTIDLAGQAVSGAEEIVVPEKDITWKSNREIIATIKSELALESGIYQVRVKNGSGQETSMERALVFVSAPKVTTIELVLACAEKSAREFTISGEGFLRIGEQLPLVRVGSLQVAAKEVSNCTAIPFEPLELQLCTSLSFEIAAGALPAGKYQVSVENPAPAGCQSSESLELLLVPPPQLISVNPDLLCLAEDSATLTLAGSGFLEIDGALPLVSVGSLSVTASLATDCTEILSGVRSCGQITVELAQGALPPGSYSVTVENPPPAGCVSTEAVTLAVADPPAIEDISPDMFCAERQDTEITISGSNFLKVGDALPRIEAGGKIYDASSATDCTKVEGTLAAAWNCKELVFILPAAALAVGAHSLRVLNPPPADCSSSGEEQLLLLPAPAIARASPVVPCDQNASQFNISGSGFMKIGSELPRVTIKGQSAQVLSSAGCSPLAFAPQVEVCTDLSVSTPSGIGQGEYLVTLENPGTHPCSASFTGFVGPPPVVSAVSPLRLCQSGGEITVTGQGFGPGAQVTISSAGTSLNLETTFVDSGTLRARLPDPTPPGLYDVTVTNSDGCSDTLEAVLDIVPLPIVFFVDPPVTYNGINLQVTLYTSGILGTVTRVAVNPHDAPAAVNELAFTFINNRRTQAVLPAGLVAGDYDVEVEDDLGCRGRLDNAFTVVEQLTVALDRVELPFGWKDARTGVNIYSPLPAPDGMANFQPTPRLYLNPSEAGAGVLASELKYVAYVSPDRVSATVPAGLAVGQYDLVAVNPDGGVGLLEKAFQVTELPPPEIYQLLPASVVNQSVQSITILGANFRNPAFSADCLQPAGSHVPLVGTITSSDASSIAVSFNFTNQSIADNSICIVTVTNDDGTYARYSALAVTNPSLNLDNFRATAPMNIARRAPCAAAGQAQPGARFLYAIGGDDGTSKNSTASVYHDTVEFAPIDPYGALGDWAVLPYRLPAGRSFHGCISIGRYIYVAGGNGGAGAEATVWRTKILDPEQAPEITDVDLQVQDDYSANLTPGRYSYRVSSLRPASDVENPAGESLASDPFMIQVPDIQKRLAITITWTPVTGSVGYRIYRTPAPDLPGGEELLLAEVAGNQLTFTDDGSVTPTGDRPLPLGALGRFQELPALNTPREGAALIEATDPQDPQTHYIYILGGRNAAQVALNSIERITITELADGRQQWATAWTAGAADIGPARWQLGAWRADQYSAPGIVPAGESWIYAGGGIDAALQFMRPDVVALKVEAGGALGECSGCRYVVDSMQPYKAGYATAACNKQLFAFGGTMANAGTESASIELCPVGGACSNQIPDPPDTANWNNLGINLTVPRYLMGGVTESAFIFLVGGIDATPQPLNSTEKTLW